MVTMKSIVVLFSLLMVASCYKVLISAPYNTKSEHGFLSIVVKELAMKGHEVTYISPFSLSFNNDKVNLIQVPGLLEINTGIDLFAWRAANTLFDPIEDLRSMINFLWSDERVMATWKNRQEFDLFIMFSEYSEMSFPFLMDFPGSFAMISITGIEPLSLSKEGNWLTPAIAPSLLFEGCEIMDFWERSMNLYETILYYKDHIHSLGIQEKLIKTYIPEFSDIISYYDRVSLTLINGHFALDGPVPLLPSQIEIGTINAKKPQPLPKDMEDFVQGSGDAGIIYFSLGSIAKSSQIPADAKRMFIEAFKIIPQRVLWKYEDKDLELPTTVKTGKWMPQQDILGHPKTRLFISHCGNLGTQEAKYHGVPVLAVPIAFDQPRNAARMARKGYALVLQWEALTVDTIVQAINTLINDTSYQERMDTVSRILQDQKDTPAERAVWWLEYVVRHKGAPHLQYAGKRLSLFQYVMLDVIFFWLAVLLFIIFVFVYVIKILCCSAKNTKKQNNKKKRQ